MIPQLGGALFALEHPVRCDDHFSGILLTQKRFFNGMQYFMPILYVNPRLSQRCTWATPVTKCMSLGRTYTKEPTFRDLIDSTSIPDALTFSARHRRDLLMCRESKYSIVTQHRKEIRSCDLELVVSRDVLLYQSDRGQAPSSAKFDARH
jgi:hypothetical protein